MATNNFIDSEDLSYMKKLRLTVKAEFENPEGVPFIEYFTTMKEYLEFRKKATSAGSEFIESAWVGYVIRKYYKEGNSYLLVKEGYVSNNSSYIILADTYSSHSAAKAVATHYYNQDLKYGCTDASYKVVTVVNGHAIN